MSPRKLGRLLTVCTMVLAATVGSTQAQPSPNTNADAGCIAKDATAAVAAFGGKAFGAVIAWEAHTFQPFGSTIVAPYADDKEGCLFGG